MNEATERFYPSKRETPLSPVTTRSSVAIAEQEVLAAMKNLAQWQREVLVSRISAKVRQDRAGGAA